MKQKKKRVEHWAYKSGHYICPNCSFVVHFGDEYKGSIRKVVVEVKPKDDGLDYLREAIK